MRATLGLLNREDLGWSQYLVLLLQDLRPGTSPETNYVALRLSDCRKLLKFFEKKDIGRKARKLGPIEKHLLDLRRALRPS